MRVVVFRNMDHLQRTMEDLGVYRFTTEESLTRVLNAMLEEQGFEPTPDHRCLVEYSMSNAWEIYQCLLYAEIESYYSMRRSFDFRSLDEFLDQNASIVTILKQLRDKLLHPMKDLDYKETSAKFLRVIDSRYPMHFHFTEQLQIQLDAYLCGLKMQFESSLLDEVSNLPDNQLRVFLTREESDIKTALAQANSDSRIKFLKKCFRNCQKSLSSLEDDPSRQATPLSPRQLKTIGQLHNRKRFLSARPLPTSEYHSPIAIQTPIREDLHLYFPMPSELYLQDSNLDATLPPPLDNTRSHFTSLIFRAVLILNESLDYGDSLPKKRFPEKSTSEIQAIDNSKEHFPAADSPKEITVSLNGTSPGIVALAMLADPLREYRKVIMDHPALQVSELSIVASQDLAANLAALRNTVFHVPDARVRNPYRVETEFWSTSTDNYHHDLISGLWRFFSTGGKP